MPDIDPRGPIASVVDGRIQGPIVRPGHVELKAGAFDPCAVPPLPGKPHWIWLGGAGDPERPLVALFRKEIELQSAPKRARLWFSADTHARIYVNGRMVARGPDDAGQDYPGQQTGKWFVDYRDLTPFFRAGRNSVAAEVFSSEPMEASYCSTGHGGLLCELALAMPEGKTQTIETDPTWRAIPSDCWRFDIWKSPGDGKETRALQYHAAQEPEGWRLPGFDDSRWPACDDAKTKWPPLVLSEIPPRLEATYPIQGIERPTANVAAHGETIEFKGAGSCAVRFDRVLSGFIGLRVRGTAGSVLAVQPNEPDAPGFHRIATAQLQDGVQEFELPFYDSFSVINLVSNGPLEILDVRANMVAQPVTYEGQFECSDPKLNKIWEVSRWLTQICQQTHHLDSPHHQEPISDPGDYLIISLNNFYAFGQPYLARQDLRKYAWLLRATHYRPFHTSYALLWLQMLMNYERYTGDSALVRELAPTVEALLAQFTTYIGKNGIVSEAPDYMFMDWVTIGGFPTHHPPAVIGQGYMTAFFYRALEDGAHVAQLVGNAEKASGYERLRAQIYQAYNRELWDPIAGLYRDGKPFVTSVKPGQWLPADTDIETHSTQNNSLAVLYDLAPPERRAPIMRALMGHDLNTQPYFMHFVFGALAHAGVFETYAHDQMLRWKIEPDTQSFREMWGNGDYSHAWQCTPLYQMSARILGVTPLTPGFAKIRIAPTTCGLNWARGVVPTPHGPVTVNWKRQDYGYVVDVRVPGGTAARFEPQTYAMRLIVDGKTVAPDAGGGRISVELSSGRHVIRVEPKSEE